MTPEPERHPSGEWNTGRRRTITALSTPALNEDDILLFPLDRKLTTALVRAALDEDDAFNDITTIATVVSDRRSRATLVAREPGVICGVPLAREALRMLVGKASIRVEHVDGSSL